MKILDELNLLCKIHGVSGYEESISKEVSELFNEYCDDVQTDKFGSVIAFKKGTSKNAKNIALMAHLDEIGLLVKKIDKDGFLYVTNIGGVDTKVLLAQEVVVHGTSEIFGVIGAKPPHLLDPKTRNQAVTLDQIYIDIGMSYKEAIKYIKVGNVVTVQSGFKKMNQDISSKSLDNRAGVWTLYQTSRMLKNIIHENNIYFITSVQEEVGLRGAHITTHNTDIDLAVIVDVSFGDYPEGARDETSPLGKGPVIAKGPILNSCICNKILEICKDNRIPYNIEIEPSSTGTEAWATQVARNGIATSLVSIPLRYMHTPIEQVNIEDLKNTANLLSKISSLTKDEMEEMFCY